MRQSKACSDVSPSRRLRIPSIPYSLVKQRTSRFRPGCLSAPRPVVWRGRVSTGMPPPSQAIRFRLFCLGICWLTTCLTKILHVTDPSFSSKTGLRMHIMHFLHGSLGGQSSAAPFRLCVVPGSSLSTAICNVFSSTKTLMRSPSLTVPAKIWLARRFCSSRWMMRLSGRAP